VRSVAQAENDATGMSLAVQFGQLQPIYRGAAFPRNAVNGFRLHKGNQGIPDGVPRRG